MSDALLTPRDWQAIALIEAGKHTGTREGMEKLAESRRYGALADEIERLRAALAEPVDMNAPSICGGCGKTIAQHDSLLRCPRRGTGEDVSGFFWAEDVSEPLTPVGEPAGESTAAVVSGSTPEPGNFDLWSQNPYTIALQKSIAEDYVPAHPPQQVTAEPLAWKHRSNTAHFVEVSPPSAIVNLFTPLYASPPPPQEFICSTGLCHYRRPLSEDQIVDIWAGVSQDYDDEINIIELGRAIEKAHGISGEQP